VIAVVGVWAVVGAVLIAAGGRLRHRAFLAGAVAPAVTLAWLAPQVGRVVDGATPGAHRSWVGLLDLSLDLRLDGLGATMVLVVAGIGLLVMLYSAAYFEHHGHDLARLAGLLVLFGGAMVGLVLADHLIALYAFWEATTVTSYLLIGHDHRERAARRAALQAVLVTGAGGLAMLGGLVLLGQAAGTYRLSELGAADPSGGAVVAASILILLGAFTKSAQYPFHAWLPAAMAAPTPVSTYLHAATMVKAGVVLVARLAPVLAAAAPWRPLVLAVGAATLVGGGLRALRQDDLKLLLAHGTVSQLGLMMLLFGAGTPALTAAGWDLLVAHALFKGALFMVVGVIDTATGTRDARRIPVLTGRSWRGVEVATVAAAASMAGIPLGIGFVAKEAAYDGLAGAPFGARGWLLAAVVSGAMLTVAYSYRFYDGAFLAARRRRAEGELTEDEVTEGRARAPSLLFSVPPALLAAGGLVLGVAPHLADPLVTATIRRLGAPRADVHLALWHGPTLALALTILTLAGGAAITWAREPVGRAIVAAGRSVPGADAAFRSIVDGLGRASRRVTGVVQNGSLPVYAGVVLATAAALPGAVLLARWSWPSGLRVLGSAAEVPITAMLAVAALGAASIRRRFSAALLLGTAGYSMAALFVLYGAPDLALTQVAIETLSTVLFVLVLRRLPDRFERQASARRRVGRLAIAGAVGAMVFTFALAAAGSSPGRPFAGDIVARAVPDGGGRNVVNVVLVDFRALDTMVEITVLAAASIGAVALARAGRVPRALSARRRPTAAAGGAGGPTPPPPAPTPVTVSAPVSAPARIVFVDVTLRIVFYAVLMVALWLLFAGHNQPGGGFVAGLLAGAAVALQFIAGGMPSVLAISRFKPWTVLGAGLLTAAGTAALPLAFGHPVLHSVSRTIDLPVAGPVKLGSALIFDVGVFVTVVGMVLMVFEAFGDEPAPERS